MRYELLIFDWDGTLMDSAGEIVAAMQSAIAQLKLPARSDDTLRRLIGLDLVDAFGRLYPELELDDVLRLGQAYRALYGATPRVYGQLFNGVDAALTQLSGQGRRMAVATGKSRRGLDKALDALRWQGRFHASRCADETAGKPNPRMLQELLAELDVAAERALMIGDTSYDMAMAKSIGMDALGVAWGVHDEDELVDAGACVVLPGVTGLPGWLALREA